MKHRYLRLPSNDIVYLDEDARGMLRPKSPSLHRLGWWADRAALRRAIVVLQRESPGTPLSDPPAPDMPAPHLEAAGGVSRPADRSLTGAVALADNGASYNRVSVVTVKDSSTICGLPGGNAFTGVPEAQVHRIAALINADYNFPWETNE